MRYGENTYKKRFADKLPEQLAPPCADHFTDADFLCPLNRPGSIQINIGEACDD